MTSWFRSNRFKVAVIGCRGENWHSWISSVREQPDESIELVAVADPNPAAAGFAGNEFGVASFTSLERMVKRTAPDGLVVALPPHAQAWATIDALEHGIHVLCEAPFGRSAREAQQMVDAASRAGRILAAGYPALVQYRWARELAQRGRIGMPHLLEADWRRSFVPPNLEGVGITLARWLLAAALPLLCSPPAAVTAIGWRHAEEGTRRSTIEEADGLSLVVDCENGARAQFLVDGVRKGQDPFLRCHSSNGSLTVPLRTGEPDDTGSEATFVDLHGQSTRGEPQPSHWLAVHEQVRNWVRACQDQESLLSGPDYALDVHEVLEAAHRSIVGSGQQLVI